MILNKNIKVKIINHNMEHYKIIGNIDNLCITKRKINSSKQNKNYDNYKIKLKQNDKEI